MTLKSSPPVSTLSAGITGEETKPWRESLIQAGFQLPMQPRMHLNPADSTS
ncbi:hypothetical protein ACRRTK_019468 [Alexandromys fortis]